MNSGEYPDMAVITTLDEPLEGKLDPTAAWLLEQSRGRPAVSEIGPAAARDQLEKMAKTFGGVPPTVAATSFHEVPTPHGPVSVRVISPLDPIEGAPVLYLHGGGFMLGSAESYDTVLRNIAVSLRRPVLAPDYGLAPENPFPIAVDQVAAVYQWLYQTPAYHGGSGTEGVIVIGDSAGGNLAAGLSARMRDRGIAPKAQVLIYPVTNHRDFDTESFRQYGEGFFLSTADMRFFLGHYLPPAIDPADPDISPQLAIAPGLPPTLVLTAEFDPLRSDGERYARLVQETGTPMDYGCFAGQLHGFHMVGGLYPAAAAATEVIRDFVARYG